MWRSEGGKKRPFTFFAGLVYKCHLDLLGTDAARCWCARTKTRIRITRCSAAEMVCGCADCGQNSHSHASEADRRDTHLTLHFNPSNYLLGTRTVPYLTHLKVASSNVRWLDSRRVVHSESAMRLQRSNGELRPRSQWIENAAGRL